MRIVHIIDLLIFGGAQKLLVYFAKEARYRGIEMEVISLRPNWSYSPFVEQLRELGVNVTTLNIRRLYDFRAIPTLWRILRHGKFDIVQTHLTHANVLGVSAARLAGLPVIATLHTTNESDLAGLFKARRMLQRFTLRRLASRVLAVGDVVAAAHQGRLRGRKIDVIPNAVMDPPELGVDERLTLRRTVLGNPVRFFVLAVGRMITDKGFDDLIDAFELVVKQNPSAYLLIAGDGELFEDLQRQVQQKGLSENVGLPGSRDDVPQLMAAADMYVSSSRREGLSIAMLEAMSAGLPIVATTVGEAPMVLAEGRGVLVAPRQIQELAQALNNVIENADLREGCGSAARAYVRKNYNLSLWMDRLLDLYRQEIHL